MVCIRIAVLGAGAMGSLFGAMLSRQNQVWLVDVDEEKVDRINSDGITVVSGGETNRFRPLALHETNDLGEVDLIIVFVKAMHSEQALSANEHLIGPRTIALTLQNGAGHEDVLGRFVPEQRLVLGTTEHNSFLGPSGEVHHGGGGETILGVLGGGNEMLQHIVHAFRSCGISTKLSNNIKENIWRKLFMNASASVMTAILQVKLGYVLDNEHAWFLVQRLLHEAVEVANADGMDFDATEIVGNVRDLLHRVYEGYTSIYADLKNGRRTEVDTINGSIVKKAKDLGVEAPTHEFVTRLIHAMEER